MSPTWKQIVKYAKKTQLGKKAKHLKGTPKLVLERRPIRRGRDFGSHTTIERNGKVIGIEKVSVNKNIKNRKVRQYIALHELREGIAAIQGKKNPHRSALRYGKRDREYLKIKGKGGHTKVILDLTGYEFVGTRTKKKRRKRKKKSRRRKRRR